MTRIIKLTVNPDEVTSYSINLTKSSGTFAYAGVLAMPPVGKQIVNVQGLNGTVERVGKRANRSDGKDSIEGRTVPMFQQAVISVLYPSKVDGTPYRIADLVAAVAQLAGTVVTFAAVNNPLTSFEFTGHFVEALNQLAGGACGELVQQNGQWFILNKYDTLGTFTIPVEDITGLSQDNKSDIADQILSLIGTLRGLYDDQRKLKDRRSTLEMELDQLNSAQTDDPEYNSYVSSVSLGEISFEFGRRNKKTAIQPVPSNIIIEGGTWESFTPENGESFNPDRKTASYYQVRPVLFNGQATNQLEGCTSLRNAKMLFPVTEPSNASGHYWAKGYLFNLQMTTGYGGSEFIPWAISPEYRVVDEQDSLGNVRPVRQLYFGFLWEPLDGYDTAMDDDYRLYRAALQLSYLPAVINKWQFAGTVSNGAWVLKRDGVPVGYVEASGKAYNMNGSHVKTVSSLSELDSLMSEEQVIKNNEGRVVGTVSQSLQARSLTGEDLGSMNATTRIFTLGSRINGFVAGAYSFRQWPGISSTAAKPQDYNIYFMSLLTAFGSGTEDPNKVLLENELNRLKLDEDVNAAKLLCLSKELEKLGASSLSPYLTTSCEAWRAYHEYIDGQDEVFLLNNKSTIDSMRVTAMNADNSLMAALSALSSPILETNVSFVYNNVLPLPGNQLLISDVLDGASWNLNCGTVESVDFNGSTVSVRATVYAS